MSKEKIANAIENQLRADIVLKEYEVLKRMRIIKRMTQKQSGEFLGLSVETMRRFESGIQNFEKKRRRKLLQRYGYAVVDLNDFMTGRKYIPLLHIQKVLAKGKADPKTYRSYQKKAEKEHRVLKILRVQAGLSQTIAGKKCGHSKSYIQHLESGRNNLTRDKITKVVRSYGFTIHDFDTMLSQPLIRDDLLMECTELLNKKEDEKLVAVKALLEHM